MRQALLAGGHTREPCRAARRGETACPQPVSCSSPWKCATQIGAMSSRSGSLTIGRSRYAPSSRLRTYSRICGAGSGLSISHKVMALSVPRLTPGKDFQLPGVWRRNVKRSFKRGEPDNRVIFLLQEASIHARRLTLEGNNYTSRIQRQTLTKDL